MNLRNWNLCNVKYSTEYSWITVYKSVKGTFFFIYLFSFLAFQTLRSASSRSLSTRVSCWASPSRSRASWPRRPASTATTRRSRPSPTWSPTTQQTSTTVRHQINFVGLPQAPDLSQPDRTFHEFKSLKNSRSTILKEIRFVGRRVR